MSWISLHVHSQYSILNATSSVKALAKRAKEMAMPALGLTDFANMFGAIEFFTACRKKMKHQGPTADESKAGVDK